MLICLISAGLPGALDAKQLSFYHTHTHERLDIVYFENGEYVDSALEEINRYLGDFRTGDTTVMDPGLLDLIYDIQETLGSHGTYEVISAYRSPETNDMLRATGGGVARNSQHLLGTAIDVRLEDIPIEVLRDAALSALLGPLGLLVPTSRTKKHPCFGSLQEFRQQQAAE
jgi:uncharacterized protein YcbK (DUF882 family)